MTDTLRSVDGGRIDSTSESLNTKPVNESIPSENSQVQESDPKDSNDVVVLRENSPVQPIFTSGKGPEPIKLKRTRAQHAQTLTKEEFQAANKLPEQFFRPGAVAAISKVQPNATKRPRKNSTVKKMNPNGQSQQILTAFDFKSTTHVPAETDLVISGSHQNDRSTTTTSSVSMSPPNHLLVDTPPTAGLVGGKLAHPTKVPPRKKSAEGENSTQKKPRQRRIAAEKASSISMNAITSTSAPLVEAVMPANGEGMLPVEVAKEEPTDIPPANGAVDDVKKPLRRSLRTRDKQAELTMLEFVEQFSRTDTLSPKTWRRTAAVDGNRVEKKAQADGELTMLEFAERFARTDLLFPTAWPRAIAGADDGNHIAEKARIDRLENERRCLRAKQARVDRARKLAEGIPLCLRTISEGGSLPDAFAEESVLLERDTQNLSPRDAKEVEVELSHAIEVIQAQVAAMTEGNTEMVEDFRMAAIDGGSTVDYMANVANFFDLPDQRLSFVSEKFQWIAKLFLVTSASVNKKTIWQNIARFLPEYLPNHHRLELYEEGQRLGLQRKQEISVSAAVDSTLAHEDGDDRAAPSVASP
ncbi:enolase [Perkinsela sp. CCAP 1560/4]|nr:enolase [Perkinsela sp. CCAP 1560/4]|eukprot:KNH07314.1 enolase [Perkinsela sp. CCAP 1560/4]